MSGVPVRAFVSEPLVEDVRAFLDRVASLPDAVAVVVLPDVHVARPACVGVVVMTERWLYPELLGSDLGCGMSAVPLGVDAACIHAAVPRRAALQALARAVPVLRRAAPTDARLPAARGFAAYVQESDGRFELGTLGRGNHFVELRADDVGELWLVVHTGSRAIGPAVQRHHVAVAAHAHRGLVAIDAASEPGRAYLHDADAAVAFAQANRVEVVREALDGLSTLVRPKPDERRAIDCQHDSIRRESHDGVVGWVHRKGATHLPAGGRALVPGSMGAPTHLVVGTGSAAALDSCAHGAGRAVPRGQARRRFDRRSLAEAMVGVCFDARKAEALRDEAPQAYKDLTSVMRAQRELVRIERTLRPLVVHKGG